MSPSLDQNKTEFEIRSNERLISKLPSAVTSSTSSSSEILHRKILKTTNQKIDDNLYTNFNTTATTTTIATTARNHSKSRKFRGKRKKIKKRYNNKNKLKFDQEENIGNSYFSTDINNDNYNSNYNNSNNINNYNTNRNTIKLNLSQDKNINSSPSSSIEVSSSLSSASALFSSERKYLLAKNILRKSHRNKKQRRNRKFLKNNKGYRNNNRNNYSNQHSDTNSNSNSNSSSSSINRNSNSNSNSIRNNRNNIKNKFTNRTSIFLKEQGQQQYTNDEENYDSGNDFPLKHNNHHHHKNYQYHKYHYPHHHHHHQQQHHHHQHHQHHQHHLHHGLHQNHQFKYNSDKQNTFNRIQFNNIDGYYDDNNDNDEIIDNDNNNDNDDIDEIYHRRRNKNMINIDIDADIIDNDEDDATATTALVDNNNNYNNNNYDSIDYNTEYSDKVKGIKNNRNFKNYENEKKYIHLNTNNNNINNHKKYNNKKKMNNRKDEKLLQERRQKKIQNQLERNEHQLYNQRNPNEYNKEYLKIAMSRANFILNKTDNKNQNKKIDEEKYKQQQQTRKQQINQKKQSEQFEQNSKQLQFPEDNFIQISSKPSNQLMKKSNNKRIHDNTDNIDYGGDDDDDDDNDNDDTDDDDDSDIDNAFDNNNDNDNVNNNVKSNIDGIVNLDTVDNNNSQIEKLSLKNIQRQRQQRSKQQYNHQQQKKQKHLEQYQKSLENINQSVVSTLNHYSVQSQEEQLVMMMEKSNQKQQQQQQQQNREKASSSSIYRNQYLQQRPNRNHEEKHEKIFNESIQLNRFPNNNKINTSNNQYQNNVSNSNDNKSNINNKYNSKNDNTNKKSDDINNLRDITSDGSDDSNTNSNSNSNNNNDILSQEDFITSQHSVEKLMEITSIEKDIDENETGDLSCFQDDDFQPAPEIPHADIKYLRNEENGLENSFLEVEYICHHDYELQWATDSDDDDIDGDYDSVGTDGTDGDGIGIDINLNEKQRNIFCKNHNWIGTPPFCVKIKNENNRNNDDDINDNDSFDGQQQNGNTEYKLNKTCNYPEKCDQLCFSENGIEKCSCHKGFQLNNSVCEDINECLERNGHGPCQDICINTWGSYKCSCESIPGSHLNTDAHTCMEIDECTQNNGGCSHTCIHTMGQAYCLCPEGYTLDKDWKTCVDIDECAEQASDDSSELRCEFGCINTPGSYTCLVDFGAEQSIYEGTLTECADGFYHNSSTADCEDINECAEKNGGCLHRCINTFGSFYCSCLPGYHIDTDMKSCIAPPAALNNNNTANGIYISCPPLFPPKHGYLECSRPLIETNEITETNNKQEIYHNGFGNCSNNGENNGMMIATNNGNNISTSQNNNNNNKNNDNNNKQKQEEEQQNQQESHLTTNHPGSQCVLRCPTGFRINGNFSKQCNNIGKWIGDDGGTCIRYPTPKLICPTDITLETPPNERMAKLKIPRPRTDVNYDRDISISPEFLKTSNDIAFEIGTRNITYTATNPVSKLSISCSFKISVVEGESPTVKYCPGLQKYSLEKQHDSIKVNWKEPIFQDNVNVTEISKTNAPGNNFGIGSHQIVYIAKDEAGYSARCIFKIIINVPPQDVLIHPLPFYRMFYKK